MDPSGFKQYQVADNVYCIRTYYSDCVSDESVEIPEPKIINLTLYITNSFWGTLANNVFTVC